MNIGIRKKPDLVESGLVIVLAIALLINSAACGSIQATGTSIVTHVAQLQSTAVPTAVSSPILSAAALPSPTKMVTTNSACWSMQNVSHRSLSGSLFYEYMIMSSDTGAPLASAPAAFNLKSGYPKGLKKFSLEAISPDGKVILTQPTESSWVFLTENQNFSYPIPNVTPRKDSTYMFLPNDQLLWEGPPLYRKDNLSNGVARDMYILSLDTGKLTFYQSIFLPYSTWNPSATYAKYAIGLYSPDLNYILYPAKYQDVDLSILLNIESQKIIWYGWPNSSLGFISGATVSAPIWRRDSSGVILHKIDDKTGIENFYNLSIDGQLTQLTYMEELFPSSRYTLSSPAISPNGRYLAFALVQDVQAFPSRNSWLLILDLENGTIMNPCITLANHPYPPYPVWSPDSNAIAVIPDAGDAIVAVDLNKKILFNIFPKTGLDTGSLLGWANWEIP